MDSPHPHDSEIQAPRRLKVLLGCYACDPYRGSEPGTGWNFLSIIARRHEVHAIVEKYEFEESLARFSQEHPEAVKNITFHFVPRQHHDTLRKIWPPSYYWFYRAWNKSAYELARKLDREENFDVVHQVTLTSFREPGYLWKLEKPFVMGPLGGFRDTPWCMLGQLGIYGGLFLGIRNILNFFQKRWGRAGKRAARHSSAILTSSLRGIDDIRRFWNCKSELMYETGPAESTGNGACIHTHEVGQALRICWVGELVPRKALNLLLKALPRCQEKMELHVFGKGTHGKRWQELAQRLGVSDLVLFHGSVPRAEVLSQMRQSHACCMTSVRDDTATVVFEALGCGVPVLATEECGFSDIVDASCGFRIPLKSPSQVVKDFARHLDYLATHENERQKLAKQAIIRCREFNWESKGEELDTIYRRVVKKTIAPFPPQCENPSSELGA